jgi:hypothetical protein
MKRRGADFRVRIDGVFYGFSSIGVSGNVADLIVSNTEGIPGNPLASDVRFTTARIADLPDGQFTLSQATFDDADNPFAAPVSLELGEYYVLEGFPSGEDGPSYDWGNCMLCNFNHSARVPGPQPLELTFKPDGVDVLTMLAG